MVWVLIIIALIFVGFICIVVTGEKKDEQVYEVKLPYDKYDNNTIDIKPIRMENRIKINELSEEQIKQILYINISLIIKINDSLEILKTARELDDFYLRFLGFVEYLKNNEYIDSVFWECGVCAKEPIGDMYYSKLNYFKRKDIEKVYCNIVEGVGIIEEEFFIIDGEVKRRYVVKNDYQWKIEALELCLMLTDEDISEVTEQNKSKTQKIIEDINREMTLCQKRKKEIYEQYEVEKAKRKILESERKKEIKAKAKKEMDFNQKINSGELYGEVLYKGVMYSMKTKEDLVKLLNLID